MSEWDKLCKEFDESLLRQEYLVPKSLIHQWKKVWAEGDGLQEELEASRAEEEEAALDA